MQEGLAGGRPYTHGGKLRFSDLDLHIRTVSSFSEVGIKE